MTSENTTDAKPDEADTVPKWARGLAYLLTVVVAGAALAASAHGLYTLGRIALYPEWVSFALFIGLDAGAAGAGVLWAAGAPGSVVRAIGRRCGKTLIAASAVCNGLAALAIPQRAILAGYVLAAIAVLIGVLFPIIAGAMLHMTLLVKDSQSKGASSGRTFEDSRETVSALGRAMLGRAIAYVTEPAVRPLSARQLDAIERDARRHSEDSGTAPGTPENAGVDTPTGPTPTVDDGRPALERARDWCRGEFAAGRRNVTATAANLAIGTNGYVKRDEHVAVWRAEWEAEQRETAETVAVTGAS